MDAFILSQAAALLIYTIMIFVIYEIELRKQTMLENELSELRDELETLQIEIEMKNELFEEMESLKEQNSKLLIEVEYQSGQLGKIVKAAEDIQTEAELPPLVPLVRETESEQI